MKIIKKEWNDKNIREEKMNVDNYPASPQDTLA